MASSTSSSSAPPPITSSTTTTTTTNFLAQVLSPGGTANADFIRHLALSGAFSEISNLRDAVRLHVYRSAPAPAKKRRHTGRVEAAVVFVVYQTGRHGPQNGFRLVVVHRGFPIASPSRPDDQTAEDEIDALERPIPQGHMEVVVLGQPMMVPDLEDEDGDEGDGAGKSADE